MIKSYEIEYPAEGLTFKAYVAFDENIKEKKPGILIASDWSGRNDFACQKARLLAEEGYLGFALDMFGDAKQGETKEEKAALIQPLVIDRIKLQRRMLAAYEEIKKIEIVDAERIGAIGFCFGGLCVLDLARSGADVKGVVSFHGLLNPPEKIVSIKSKILVLHGYADPMVPPEEVLAFANEMTKAKVDWQIHLYGHTLHAFTNPNANDPDFGTVYNANADARSWRAMKNFFEDEVFGKKQSFLLQETYV